MNDPADVLNVVIVDDEEPARMALRQALDAVGGVVVLAECANGFEAVKAMGDVRPDVLILDVQMPKLDGFDVLELVGADVPVIFVTAYDEFALRAFEVHAVDYLLKPFAHERLAEALSRVRERQGAPGPVPAALRASARPPGVPLERVVIRDGAQVHVVAAEKIDYVEAQDDYVAFKTGREDAAEGADAGRSRGATRCAAVRPHPPVVPPQHRTARARRALREGQPDRHSRRRHQAAGQPIGLSEAAAVAVRGE